MSTENGEVTPAALSLTDLKPKMELKGTVTRIELFGAFVDVGVGRDGLVHISQIRTDEPVKNVNDVLKVGEQVTVWVRSVDQQQGRIDLTMIEPPGMMWEELRTGQVLTGKVVRVEKFGAFIDVGAERPGMVHVSELSSGYVGSPQEVVKVGDEVQVKVIKVNSKKKQIDLSMKALEEPVAQAVAAGNDEEDSDLPAATAMEVALRRALQQNTGEEFPALERAIQTVNANKDAGRKAGKSNKKDKRSNDRRRQQQEELLSRTLRNNRELSGERKG